jgi:predicted nucleic acid-binding Zn finger protein
VDINKYESLLTKAEKEIKDIEKNGNKKEDIEKRIREIKTEYKDNLKKIEDLQEKNGEKEEIQKLSDRNNEIEAITKALVLKEAEIHMKEYLNNSWETLEIKLNENCDYYFGGEYVSQKEFMKMLQRKKIDLSKTRFVNFDVELDNYDSIDQYLIYEKSDKRNFTIKDLILTDDKNFGKGTKITKNQEIQYKAERYINMESSKNIK